MRLTKLVKQYLFIGRLLSCSVLIFVSSVPAGAQFSSLNTKLKPQTAAEFQGYAQRVEAGLNTRWNDQARFLQVNDDPLVRQKVLGGDLLVQAEHQPNPTSISNGLIHDWFGAVFIPNATLQKVLTVLQDFDHHSAIYPQVIHSHLIKRSGNDFTGYWRLEQKGQMLPATFDVTQTAHYQQIAADKWIGVSHADDIQAVENTKTLPPGEGIGLMWKLYSYWALEQVGSGVIAECRTVSLSRGVPGAMAWMIKPFVNTIPRESMDSTLRNTRKASGE